MRTILLIMIGLSTFLSADFTKSRDVITDSKTGLEWQDNNESNSTKRSWQGAIDYCESLSLNAYDDWRLPNINELKTLIDRSKEQPAIVNGFEYVQSDSYWSSTSIVDHENVAWFVYFYNGSVFGDPPKDDNLYVRCVRDGQ